MTSPRYVLSTDCKKCGHNGAGHLRYEVEYDEEGYITREKPLLQDCHANGCDCTGFEAEP